MSLNCWQMLTWRAAYLYQVKKSQAWNLLQSRMQRQNYLPSCSSCWRFCRDTSTTTFILSSLKHCCFECKLWKKNHMATLLKCFPIERCPLQWLTAQSSCDHNLTSNHWQPGEISKNCFESQYPLPILPMNQVLAPDCYVMHVCDMQGK